MEMMQKTTVNGREYGVRMFDALEAFQYLHNLILARAVGRGLTGLGRIALGRCVDPKGRDLSNDEDFRASFADNPADMLELERKAIETLTAPYEGVAESK